MANAKSLKNKLTRRICSQSKIDIPDGRSNGDFGSFGYDVPICRAGSPFIVNNVHHHAAIPIANIGSYSKRAAELLWLANLYNIFAVNSDNDRDIARRNISEDDFRMLISYVKRSK